MKEHNHLVAVLVLTALLTAVCLPASESASAQWNSGGHAAVAPIAEADYALFVRTSDGLVTVSPTGVKETLVRLEAGRSVEVADDRLYLNNQSGGGDILIYGLDGSHLSTIPIPPEASGYLNFVVLPDDRMALLDNVNDKIFFIDSDANLLATTEIKDVADNQWQNLDGVAVGSQLVLSEDGDKRLLTIDLVTYEAALFKDLRHLPVSWLGSITHGAGQYYLTTPRSIYRFAESGSAVKVAELPEGNLTGIAVLDMFAYVCVNFSGKIYKVNLSDGTSSVLASGLNYPEDLELRVASSAPDTTPPAAIGDLSASPGSAPGAVQLTWTASGDDGRVGTASNYIVRHNSTRVTDSNWGTSTNVAGEPRPGPAGSAESMTVSGLTPGQTYYFAIQAQDEVPNTSTLSNSPSAEARTSAGFDSIYVPLSLRLWPPVPAPRNGEGVIQEARDE